MTTLTPKILQSQTRTLAEAKQAILRSFKTNTICMLWGPSGIGKTEMIEDLVKEIPNSMQIILSLASRDPLDFTGIPSLRGNRTVINNPTLVPLQGDILPQGVENVIVFIDELPEGDTPTLKAVYRLLNEGMVNDKPVHEAVRFVASGNPPNVGALTKDLLPTVANRLFHIFVDACYKEWIAWATKKGISPIHRAFVAAHPNFLTNYNDESDDVAFATPRTHARLHEYMDGDSFTELNHIVQGAPVQFLGKEAGLALLSFAQSTDIPNLESLLRDPSIFNPDELRPGSLFLLGQSLISVVRLDNIEPVLALLDKMPGNHKAINFMSICSLPIFSDLLANNAFADFVTKNKKLIRLVNT